MTCPQSVLLGYDAKTQRNHADLSKEHIFFILKRLDTRFLDHENEDTRGHVCGSLKMKAIEPFETSVTVYPVAPRHVQE